MSSTAALSGAKREHRTNSLLLEKLASVLPKGYKFGIYHLSTPPTKTDALYSAPPNERDDKTYREDHFLTVSIDVGKDDASERKQVLIFALEVFLFTTAFSTTLFVSKADSTGYLHLSNLPKGTASPIREVTAAFVSFLVEHRRRKNVQTVVSLFARAQSQYLFPGSVENKGKHVLDDRGLVKWWCRVLNPLLEGAAEDAAAASRRQEKWDGIKGYLVIPGLDVYETKAFLPRTPKALENWELGHPLERISHYTQEFDWVPPRCLIPKYPDDPKSRFRDELDEEALKRKQDTGMWKSVKSLEQFWEMMAFRQECSSGRLTGFVWIVFDPKGNGTTENPSSQPAMPTPSSPFNDGLPPTPPRRRAVIDPDTLQLSPVKRTMGRSSNPIDTHNTTKDKQKKKTKKKLKGIIIPRQPKIKTQQRNYIPDRPTTTPYYHWPPEGRGEKIVEEANYKRIVELLLHLDFATLEKACHSTARWIREVGIGTKWGREVVGTRETPAVSNGTSVGGGQQQSAAVNSLGAGLIKRKRPQNGEIGQEGGTATAVNVLGSGLVRRKEKEDAQRVDDAPPSVNVLGAGLVRKKPKI